MLKHYIKTAFRSIKKHKGISFINISGLAIGLTCSFLVFVYVSDESNYDRFHQDADRIYRITYQFKKKNTEERGLLTSYILAKTLRESYPEKFLVTQIKLWGSTLNAQAKSYGKERIIGADSSFFKMFTYQFIYGNSETALSSPHEVIITDEAALRYFGNSQAVGRIIQINGNPYTITGIIKKNSHNSHFYFDVVFALKSLSSYADTRYLYGYYSTYIKLPPAVPESRLNNILDEYIRNRIAPLLANSEFSMSLNSEPLLDIHLHSDLNGPYGANSKIEYIYIFSATALLILIIACFNYINLTTAKNLNRAKEVGIRKVVGSMRSHINRQFLTESVICCWLAAVLAIILIKIIWPFFNNLIGKPLQLKALSNPLTAAGFILFATFIGIIAGIYPALYLSSFNPIRGLQDRIHKGKKKSGLQSSLVIFQCATSVIFMISTLVIHTQLGLVQKKNLGFNKEQVIVLENGSALGRHKEVFKTNLIQYPFIINVAGTSSLPGTDFNSWSITPEDKKASSLAIYFCDFNFADTMGIKIQNGRFFSREFPGDERAIVINQKAVEEFEWAEDPIGKKIRLNVHGDYTVVGVVKDFHYESLHNPLGKMGMLLTEGRYYGAESFLAVRFSAQKIADVLSAIKKEWDSIIPNAPFEYSFLDEDYYRLYRNEQKMQKISLLFALLAIFISALGMFGLVSFSVAKRRKEIGVRKVLGAGALSINLLLCKDFIKWVLLANIAAFPTAYLILNKWLNSFAYRVPLSAQFFIFPGIFAFFTALTVVSIKVVRAALTNPVEALKYE